MGIAQLQTPLHYMGVAHAFEQDTLRIYMVFKRISLGYMAIRMPRVSYS